MQSGQGGLEMKAYSMDLREKALADSDAGMRSGLVAKK